MFIGAAWKSLYSWVAPSLSDHSVSFVNAVNIRTRLASLGLSILPIELQIRWDNLEGVNCISRRGQVLALALGGFFPALDDLDELYTFATLKTTANHSVLGVQKNHLLENRTLSDSVTTHI